MIGAGAEYAGHKYVIIAKYKSMAKIESKIPGSHIKINL
jgi:hypothetical protein